MSALSSEEVNYLVYRYLLENGFVHSAFAFGHESLVAKSNIQSSEVPPAALISFIQKGLQYTEIESHLNDDGTETMCDELFSVLTPHACRIKTKKRLYDPYEAVDADFGAAEIALEQATLLRGHADMISVCYFNPVTNILATGSADGSIRLWDTSKLDTAAGSTAAAAAAATTTNFSAATPKDKLLAESAVVLKVSKQKLAALEEKQNAAKAENKGGPGASAAAAAAAAADKKAFSTPSSHCIVSMHWNAAGTQLSSASYDGRIHIWSVPNAAAASSSAAAAAATAVAGVAPPAAPVPELIRSLQPHKGPVPCLRYNPKGDTLLTTGLDQTVTLIDTTNGQVKQTFQSHTGAVVDGDWKNDNVFATCSTDKSVLVCDGSSGATISKFYHSSEVNTVRWDPTGTVLASAADDGTVKVWSMDSEHSLHDFRDHERPVGCLAWAFAPPSVVTSAAATQAASSTGSAAAAASATARPLLLASGSQDATVRVWLLDSATSDEKARCLYTLNKHAHPVTALAFSPGNSEYLASASHDRLHIWSLKDGSLARTFKSEGGINDLSWDSTGRRLCACYSDHTAYVIELK